MDRRSFLYNISISAGGVGLVCAGLSTRAAVFSDTGSLSELRAYGYGELSPVAAKNTRETLISLPNGFEYNVLGKMKTKMSDGNMTPPAHDGMATFEFGGEIRIVRNHEVTNSRQPIEGSAIGENAYDETAGGGTTTLVINRETNEIERDFVSLSGTLINCAGGPTPWRSWISCEEGTLGKTVITDERGRKYGGFQQPHGYCFEVPASANSPVKPVPLKAMGRFVHEAVAVDAARGIVYLTEDNRPAGFYRFLPNRNRRLAEGGVLQILTLKNNPNFDTMANVAVGTRFYAGWATIDNPDPEEADNDIGSLAVFKQGSEKGAARFSRLEGCYADDDGRIYFISTDGGNIKGGQIWKYEPAGKDSGLLTLVFESPSVDLLDMPDNLCLRPNSEQLFICEDGNYGGLDRPIDNYLKILTPDGKITDFSKNIMPDFERSEFAGSTFSADGKTLFVNLQGPGVTLAIWGDWNRFKA